MWESKTVLIVRLSWSTSCERTSKLRLSDKLQKDSFLPVMEKLSRPCLEVSGPLSIVRLEHHTWQVSDLIRGILSPGELTHGQQTHQQTTGEHIWTKLTSNYKKNQQYTTPLMDLGESRGSFVAATSPNVLNGSSAWTSRIKTSYDCCCGPRDQRLTLYGSSEANFRLLPFVRFAGQSRVALESCDALRSDSLVSHRQWMRANFASLSLKGCE